jgi:hypothetical protein
MKQTDEKGNPLTYWGGLEKKEIKERAKNYMRLKDGYKDKISIKEQYKEIVCGFNEERTENVTNRCVEIAEQFTIKFIKWYDLNYFVYNTFTKTTTIEEMLQIFKKEKGL